MDAINFCLEPPWFETRSPWSRAKVVNLFPDFLLVVNKYGGWVSKESKKQELHAETEEKTHFQFILVEKLFIA